MLDLYACPFFPMSSSTSNPATRLSRRYDTDFVVTPDYKDSLPDMQNADASLIEGAAVPILQVGISNFCLPLAVATRAGPPVPLEVSVTGTVALAGDHKGINMSRIMRTFYEFKDRVFSLERLEEILLHYKSALGTSRARLRLSFRYPILKPSLRSDLAGWQYYDVVLEGLVDDLDRFRKRVHFDFVYSSACPCSAELAEHAREARDSYGIPHSQRSKARISLEVRPGASLPIEDIQELCLKAIHTETQVMVKREDEQAFAELNGAYPKFVEDAARLFYDAFAADSRIADFQVACAHLESLHSHDAVAVINRGIPGGFDGSFEDFKSLIC